MGKKSTIHITHNVLNSQKEQLSQLGECPFSKMVGKLNKIQGMTAAEKMPKIKHIITQAIANVFQQKKKLPDEVLANAKKNFVGAQSQAKIDKYVYDVAYLQEEVFPLLHTELQSLVNMPDPALYELGTIVDLHDKQERSQRGIVFRQMIIERSHHLLQLWEQGKKEDQIYQDVLKYSHIHSAISKSSTMSFADIFHQGIGDATNNFYSLFYNIPELYFSKHQKLPNAEEYRTILEKNIKEILLPVASVKLHYLLFLIRPEHSTPMFEKGRLPAEDFLDITLHNFALQDDGEIYVTERYNKDKERRVGLDLYMRGIATDTNKPLKTYDGLRTGCPALVATMPDGKPIAEQFCLDLLAIADKYFFAYWDK